MDENAARIQKFTSYISKDNGQILEKIIDIKCNVYLDDIIIYGATEKEHDDNFIEVLKLLEENKFKINNLKIQYKQRQVKLLGALIDGETKRPIPEKQCKILSFKTPKTRKELESFLGFCNYYRSYIQNFAQYSAVLEKAFLKKDQSLAWTKEQDCAFETLKKLINSDAATYLPKFDEEFILTTDACDTGIGGILQQKINDEIKVIDWASKKLSPSETKYSITEKEFLGMV